MQFDFNNASFKDFEDIEGLDIYVRAARFNAFLDHLEGQDRLNYRLVIQENYGPEVLLRPPGSREARRMVSLVSNDYWGLSQHPEVISAAIKGIQTWGTGTGASPAIGGHYAYHEQLEQATAKFFGREAAMLYTTGYTANSATVQCLLRKEDIAIFDQKVHASMYEGGLLTNTKTFPHNDLNALEHVLKTTQNYRSRLVIIDGVYSQDGDLSHMPGILALCRQYGAFLCVDDAHGIGIMGQTGRGAIEHFGLLAEVDLITGTFSKTFGHLGGYVVASPELIRHLKYQSRQHLFSVTATPASAGILRAMELIDEEPFWKDQLWENIRYLKSGLESLGLDTGITQSAIVPVRIGDVGKTLECGRMLLEAGIYANPIMYPAVAKHDTRIRMNLMATHTRGLLDKVLNAYDHINQKLQLSKL